MVIDPQYRLRRNEILRYRWDTLGFGNLWTAGNWHWGLLHCSRHAETERLANISNTKMCCRKTYRVKIHHNSCASIPSSRSRSTCSRTTKMCPSCADDTQGQVDPLAQCVAVAIAAILNLGKVFKMIKKVGLQPSTRQTHPERTSITVDKCMGENERTALAWGTQADVFHWCGEGSGHAD